MSGGLLSQLKTVSDLKAPTVGFTGPAQVVGASGIFYAFTVTWLVVPGGPNGALFNRDNRRRFYAGGRS
jgi:hypothetical protein